jgi:PilZ domain
MEMDNRTERRQHPRLPVEEGVECRFELRSRVHMVDISANGALLATDLPLPVGSRASLRSNIANGPFASEVEIRRHANSAGQSLALGAIFTDMDEHSRRSLELFLKRASA